MTTYRNEQFANLMAVISVVFAIGGIFLSIRRDDLPLLERWAPSLVILALSAFVFFRLARAGVYLAEEGVRVVNPLSTVEVPWEHLVRFTLRPHKGFPAIGFAELIDGRRVQLWGIQARSPNPGAKRVPQQLIDALNERLQQRRTQGQADPPPAAP